ncbi:MAG: DUF1302 family protein [Rubrivivax sp.]|nr:DUF1302 family protein [Rubrivivax sp.]
MRPVRPRHAVALAALLCLGPARAMEIDTGDPDWALRLDNTIKGSLAYRTQGADPALVDSFRLLVPNVPQSAFPQALNFNAGDDNFRKRGLVSERVDWLGEFDAVFKRNFGLRLSAAAWYDFAYQRHTTDAIERTNGQNPYNQFAQSTVDLAGQHADLLDAFVFGGWDVGDGRKLTVRLGQYAQQWGESLFFGDNAVARAQGAIDIFKLLQSPNAQFKEILRPTPQLGAQLQVTPEVSVGAYYQFKWIEDRLAPAGSYFSNANVPWGSTLPQFVNIAAGPIAGQYVLQPGSDTEAKNSGQFGLQLKWRLDETDLGLYFAQFHDKGGQLYGNLNVVNPLASRWYYVFPEDIKVLGASATHTFGDFNVAVEGSVRDDMPLRSTNMLYPGAFAPAPQFATGRTAHINLSTLATFGPSFLARESSLVAEVAWNRVLSTNDPDGELDAGRTRDAAALQMIFTPTYRQALSGVDLSVPVGVRYSLAGCSSVTVWDCKGSGFFTLGLEGNVNNSWQFALAFQQYFGSAVPFVDYSPLLSGGSAIYGQGNSLRDRSNVTFAMRYAF